jgi:hypothetical protein
MSDGIYDKYFKLENKFNDLEKEYDNLLINYNKLSEKNFNEQAILNQTVTNLRNRVRELENLNEELSQEGDKQVKELSQKLLKYETKIRLIENKSYNSDQYNCDIIADLLVKVKDSIENGFKV